MEFNPSPDLKGIKTCGPKLHTIHPLSFNPSPDLKGIKTFRGFNTF